MVQGTSAQTGQRVEFCHLPEYSIHPALKYSFFLLSNIGNIRNMLKQLLIYFRATEIKLVEILRDKTGFALEGRPSELYRL